MGYTSAILPCSASKNPVSGVESAPVCGCQSRQLPVLTANWALFSEVPEAGSPPRLACVAGSSLSLHLIIQPVWDYTTLPHHVLVINYFPHLPKSVSIACNQLKDGCRASRHLHYNSYVWLPQNSITALTDVWLPKPASTFPPVTCAAHLLFSLETAPWCLLFLHISLFPYFGFSLLKDSQKWSY